MRRMHGPAAAVAAAALTLLAAPGCSSSASPSATSAPVSTTVPPSSGAPSTASTTLPAKATVGYPSSSAAVQHLVDAWKAGDRAAAAQGADATAVEGMWATPPGDLDMRGCAQTYAPDLTEGGCILRRSDRTGALQVNTEKRDVGWVVSSAVYEPN